MHAVMLPELKIRINKIKPLNFFNPGKNVLYNNISSNCKLYTKFYPKLGAFWFNLGLDRCVCVYATECI